MFSDANILFPFIKKNEGCSHVDGMLCDFPNCSMNNDYVKERSLSQH